MTKNEALKLAMEALHGFIPYLPLNDEAQCGRYDKAITAIKEALAQPEPWEKFCDSNCVWTDHHPDCKLAEQHQDWCASLTQMLMSMPPKPAPCNCKPSQRTWVGLRDDEIYSVLENLQVIHHRPPTTDSRVIFAQAIEAKLKEKNT